ncbi:hypothetical protein OUZ56_015893 [Daphnia magna]|uniref:Uncharacterized protein n=1 Tax=Daphnia magna TaxID=35525 RepID=A0ABR0AP51_9CRUS|nr:hypothetical protein OUZ56_015893 [Daphnia magna]
MDLVFLHKLDMFHNLCNHQSHLKKRAISVGRRGRWTSRIAAGATRSSSPWILRRAPPPTEEGAGHRGSPLELLERRHGY